MPKDKKPPALPDIFVPDGLPASLSSTFEEQLQMVSAITKRQMQQFLNHFAKTHGCVHERAVILGLLSGLVTLYQSILEPTDDPALALYRRASAQKIGQVLSSDAPEVMANMQKFYEDLMEITLSQKKDPEEPTVNVAVPTPPSPAKGIPKHLN